MSAEKFKVFEEAGLEAVQTLRDKNLIIGGSSVKPAEHGYEITEPNFSIFHQGPNYIAKIQDKETLGQSDLVRTCGSFEEAAQFICDTYIQQKVS